MVGQDPVILDRHVLFVRQDPHATAAIFSDQIVCESYVAVAGAEGQVHQHTNQIVSLKHVATRQSISRVDPLQTDLERRANSCRFVIQAMPTKHVDPVTPVSGNRVFGPGAANLSLIAGGVLERFQLNPVARVIHNLVIGDIHQQTRVCSRDEMQTGLQVVADEVVSDFKVQDVGAPIPRVDHQTVERVALSLVVSDRHRASLIRFRINRREAGFVFTQHRDCALSAVRDRVIPNLQVLNFGHFSSHD